MRTVLVAAALTCVACRPVERAVDVAEPRATRATTWTRDLSLAELPPPAWDEAANLRLSTAGLTREQLEPLRPREGPPLFVRVSAEGIAVVACEGHAAAHLRFEPEAPFVQHWVWTDVELAANVRVGTRFAGATRVEVRIAPAGTHWLDRSRIAALRRARCGDATHFVALFRVGQIDTGDSPLTGCDVSPESTTAPRDCEWPWQLELIALDPHARAGPVCPEGTSWTGRYCRAADRANQDQGSYYCDAGNSMIVAACNPRWPPKTSWIDAPIGLPARLDDEELERTMSALEPELRACVPSTPGLELEVEIAGALGRITHVELGGPTTTGEVDCVMRVLGQARFSTFGDERQTARWSIED